MIELYPGFRDHRFAGIHSFDQNRKCFYCGVTEFMAEAKTIKERIHVRQQLFVNHPKRMIEPKWVVSPKGAAYALVFDTWEDAIEFATSPDFFAEYGRRIMT